MKTIEIDEEVYAYLQSKAIPYEDKNPNDTIRRLFGFDKKAIPSRLIPLPQVRSRKVEGRKKPKASLIELVNAGLLEEGQIIHVRDYQGREIQDSEATVHQGGILRNGIKYSMSNLAEILLKGQGYDSDSVRGPAHWFTSNNISIKNLWESYLNKIA
jgi:predicted CopG family antitoxin